MPGLDGIRALAVLSVIAFHVNLSWAQGGTLGVGVFFTLSGYLITDLLLEHWRRHGDLGLRDFWLRRARRLLPALFLMLIAVSVWVALFEADELGAVRRQVVTAVLYVANWSTIAQHGSYFARFADPLPLDHLWSLAIEEQFYLAWPSLLLLAIWTLRRRLPLALLTVLGAMVSALVMVLLYRPGYDPTRVYEGTDTRAFGLLLGAATAIVWPTRVPRLASRPLVRDLLDAGGLLGLAGMALLVWRTDAFSPFLYPFGFLLLSLATAALLAAVVNPASRLGALLGCRPLRWIGVRSYGIYLWQWPIIVLGGTTAGGSAWVRRALEVAATFLAASLSWRYVEEPVRRGVLTRPRRQIRSGAGRPHQRPLALAGLASAAALTAAGLGLAGVLPAVSGNLGAASGAATLRATVERPLGGPAKSAVPPAPTHTTAASPARTGCRAVVYIGDSTSEGEISTDYIPDARLRLAAQLARVGATSTLAEISGARSIVETFLGQPDAATIAQRHISQGFEGCWILALGTNDVDNVHDDSTIGFPARIARMMSIIGRQPTLWIDAVTLLRSGPYSEAAMLRWNQALLGACPSHPNMRIFDWAAYAKPRWFIPDGIHYYSPGYVARNHLIAHGLARAFPTRAPASASCVVR